MCSVGTPDSVASICIHGIYDVFVENSLIWSVYYIVNLGERELSLSALVCAFALGLLHVLSKMSIRDSTLIVS